MFRVTGGRRKGLAGPARLGLKEGPALGVWGGAKDGGLSQDTHTEYKMFSGFCSLGIWSSRLTFSEL